RQGDPRRDRRSALLLAGLVAGRERGGLPAPRGDDRRSADGDARRLVRAVDGVEDRRPDEGLRARWGITPQLVRATVGAPGAIGPAAVVGQCRAGLDRPVTLGEAVPAHRAADP